MLREQAKVAAWKARKDKQAICPLETLLAAQPLDIPHLETEKTVCAVAKVNGSIVARSNRAHLVNQRAYFPFDSLELKSFQRSPKVSLGPLHTKLRLCT